MSLLNPMFSVIYGIAILLFIVSQTAALPYDVKTECEILYSNFINTPNTGEYGTEYLENISKVLELQCDDDTYVSQIPADYILMPIAKNNDDDDDTPSPLPIMVFNQALKMYELLYLFHDIVRLPNVEVIHPQFFIPSASDKTLYAAFHLPRQESSIHNRLMSSVKFEENMDDENNSLDDVLRTLANMFVSNLYMDDDIRNCFVYQKDTPGKVNAYVLGIPSCVSKFDGHELEYEYNWEGIVENMNEVMETPYYFSDKSRTVEKIPASENDDDESTINTLYQLIAINRKYNSDKILVPRMEGQYYTYSLLDRYIYDGIDVTLVFHVYAHLGVDIRNINCGYMCEIGLKPTSEFKKMLTVTYRRSLDLQLIALPEMVLEFEGSGLYCYRSMESEIKRKDSEHFKSVSQLAKDIYEVGPLIKDFNLKYVSVTSRNSNKFFTLLTQGTTGMKRDIFLVFTTHLHGIKFATAAYAVIYKASRYVSEYFYAMTGSKTQATFLEWLARSNSLNKPHKYLTTRRIYGAIRKDSSCEKDISKYFNTTGCNYQYCMMNYMSETTDFTDGVLYPGSAYNESIYNINKHNQIMRDANSNGVRVVTYPTENGIIIKELDFVEDINVQMLRLITEAIEGFKNGVLLIPFFNGDHNGIGRLALKFRTSPDFKKINIKNSFDKLTYEYRSLVENLPISSTRGFYYDQKMLTSLYLSVYHNLKVFNSPATQSLWVKPQPYKSGLYYYLALNGEDVGADTVKRTTTMTPKQYRNMMDSHFSDKSTLQPWDYRRIEFEDSSVYQKPTSNIYIPMLEHLKIYFENIIAKKTNLTRETIFERLLTDKEEYEDIISRFDFKSSYPEGQLPSKYLLEECPICRESFEEGETIIKLNNCDHVFHELCATNWAQRSELCAMCNGRIRAEE